MRKEPEQTATHAWRNTSAPALKALAYGNMGSPGAKKKAEVSTHTRRCGSLAPALKALASGYIHQDLGFAGAAVQRQPHGLGIGPHPKEFAIGTAMWAYQIAVPYGVNYITLCG